MRSTQGATGITVRERMAASRWGRASVAALGLALSKLSPRSGPAHYNSW